MTTSSVLRATAADGVEVLRIDRPQVRNAVNLAIFVAGRLSSNTPPLVPEGALGMATSANPLPQALILTAIVISFSLVAFTVVLFERAHRALGTLDPDAMREAEPRAEDTPARAAAPQGLVQ